MGGATPTIVPFSLLGIPGAAPGGLGTEEAPVAVGGSPPAAGGGVGTPTPGAGGAAAPG